MRFCIFFFWLISSYAKPFVIAEIRGELGNNLFIVAATCAFAWDHGADAYFPELTYKYFNKWENLPLNLAHVFFRCNLSTPPRPIAYSWHQPNFAFHKIPFHPDMKLRGYFQSEKFFAHHREKLLELFAPSKEDREYIQANYSWLLEYSCSVGIQVRKYWDDPHNRMYNQYGKDYLTKAMKIFPKIALFVVVSNDINFAKENIPEEMIHRVVFIENEPDYMDLFLLSMCKHNIISNSSFGWWGAWLNRNPGKLVIAPRQWVHPNFHLETCDILPEKWVKLDAKWGTLDDPTSY